MADLRDLPPERAMPHAHMLAREQRVEQYAAGDTRRRWATRNAVRYSTVVAGASALLIGGTAAAYVAFGRLVTMGRGGLGRSYRPSRWATIT